MLWKYYIKESERGRFRLFLFIITTNFIIFLFYICFLDLWLDWIKDEILIATTDEEKKNVIMLCEKGIGDYLSNYIIFILLNLILSFHFFFFYIISYYYVI